MNNISLPQLTELEIQEGLSKANSSARRRFPKILHNPGDEFNRVINFMLTDSYMQPHLHPGSEKIEKIYILHGSIAIFYFNDHGGINNCIVLKKGLQEMIEVPAFTLHTYVILSEYAITYETMMGKYEPKSWKEFTDYFPIENSIESKAYLAELKGEAKIRLSEGEINIDKD